MTYSTKQALFSSIKIGQHQLQHRVVLAPASRLRATDSIPNEKLVEYYQQRSSEGGLLITEATFISPLAGGYKHVPGIFTQAQIDGWKKVTTAVHKKKSVIFLQLWHLGRVGSSKLNPNGETIVSASAIRVPGKSPQLGGIEYETPHALEISEIKSIIQDYRHAAINAIEAGFDGIEIHSAFGYLVDQFINSSSNQRNDKYGGSIENRSRFALELVDEIADAIGVHRTAIRFSPGETFQDMHDETPVDTWSYLTFQLQSRHPDLAYVHFIESRSNVHVEDQINTEDSLEPYRKIWKGPFISSGGFSTAREHSIDLSEKTGNLIAFGRAFIANPDLPHRLAHDLSLNKYDRSTFYTHEANGYIDYPFYE